MAEKSRMYIFEFRGRAEIIIRTQGQETLPNESKIVSDLNDKSALIAQAIQQELVRGLSPSLSVQSQIHFFEGSITLAGVIVLMDAMATLAGAAEFVATFSRLVEIVIQSVVQRWILDDLDTDSFTTTIQVEVSQPMPTQRSEWASFQNLLRLMIANIVVLLILIILLIPSLLPNPTPTQTSIFTPSFTPTSTATPSITPSLTPSVTMTPSTTLTPSITPFPSATFTP